MGDESLTWTPSPRLLTLVPRDPARCPLESPYLLPHPANRDLLEVMRGLIGFKVRAVDDTGETGRPCPDRAACRRHDET